MISAPVETRCRSMPNTFMPRKVAASTSGMLSATTRPARRPRLSRLTASTMITASISEWMKMPTASPTIFGWSLTLPYSTPTGRSALSCCMRASRLRPSCSTSPLGTIEMAMPMASRPPKCISSVGGSA